MAQITIEAKDSVVAAGAIPGYEEDDGVAWSVLRVGSGNMIIPGGTVQFIRFTSHGDSNLWRTLERAILVFDGTNIPDGAVITAATLRLLGHSKRDITGLTPSINAYLCNPTDLENLVAGDFSRVSSVAVCDTAITYSGWNIADWNEFTLNSRGIDIISKTGKFPVVIREVKYDVGTSTPAHSASETISISFKGTTPGIAGERPQLVITYTLALPLVDTNPATDITSTSATLNGEIIDTGGENCYERGFEWAETQDIPMTTSWTESGSFEAETFSHGISGLDSSKTYYYRAKAQNSHGWGYGAVMTFLGARVYPAEAITRVTNLIHRYSPGNFTLEMALGEVTSDFGLPQYTARPVASTPAVEEGQVVTKMGVEGFQTAEQFMDVMEQGYQGRPMPESVRAKAEKTATAVEKHNREVLERLKRLAMAKQKAEDLRAQTAETRERLATIAREEEAAQKRIAELKVAGAGKPVPTFTEWLATQAKKVVERFMWWK